MLFLLLTSLSIVNGATLASPYIVNDVVYHNGYSYKTIKPTESSGYCTYSKTTDIFKIRGQYIHTVYFYCNGIYTCGRKDKLQCEYSDTTIAVFYVLALFWAAFGIGLCFGLCVMYKEYGCCKERYIESTFN